MYASAHVCFDFYTPGRVNHDGNLTFCGSFSYQNPIPINFIVIIITTTTTTTVIIVIVIIFLAVIQCIPCLTRMQCKFNVLLNSLSDTVMSKLHIVHLDVHCHHA